MKTIVKTKRTIQDEFLFEEVKQQFEDALKTSLNLTKVGAPLFVSKSSGLNDNLNGVERPVSFELASEEHEIVHSLAKWKRWYLGQLQVPSGKGIVTDMRAIRADEVLSEIHSHYVDQWDWEKVIDKGSRTIDTLISEATKVYHSLLLVDREIANRRKGASLLPDEIKVIHTEDLYQLYPEKTPKEREHAITKKYGAVLLVGIGGKLSHGEVHDLRAPDYDDWSTKDDKGRPGLNADIIVWDDVRQTSLEISSMGIRVDEEALKFQLAELGAEDRVELPFHTAILQKELPYTIGGGIGQSRVVMYVTRTGDIKDVQPFYCV